MDERIVIVGGGIEGLAAARFFIRRGHRNVTVADAVERQLPEGAVGVFGAEYLAALEEATIVIASPGLFADARAAVNAARARGATVTSNLRMFLEGLPILGVEPCPAPVAAVTGSNGKTTCTSLLHAILQRGPRAGTLWLGGNIGTPTLDILDDVRAEDLVILELSSFQLQDIERSPWLGVVLNVTPNHLDQHASFEEYALAKRRIVDRPGNTWAVLNTGNPVCEQWIREGTYQSALRTFGPEALANDELTIRSEGPEGNMQELRMPIGDVAMKTHPETLAAAVVAAFTLGASPADAEATLREFKGVEHRLQLVRELDGVRWYDDSANTTPESAVVALRAFDPGSAVILLGGSDKGTPFEDLAREVIARRARPVLLGQTAPQIRDAIHAIDHAYPVHFRQEFQTDFRAVMEEARRIATPGDAVLLSTGCASFGMFQNYKDRAAQFVAIVEGWS